MLLDLRRGFRNLKRSPRFTLASTASIALGIAGATAIFTFVHSILLAPLSFPQSDRLVVIREFVHDSPVGANPVRMHDWLAAPSVRSIAGLYDESYTVQLTDLPERIEGLRTFGDFLGTLGVQPSLGRAFTDAERRGRGAAVAILTDSAWRRRFGADRTVVGRSMRLNGQPCEIVGVLPPGVDFENAEIIAPEPAPDYSRRARFMLQIARLRPGATLAAANREIATIAQRLSRQYPATDADMTTRVVSLRAHLTGEARAPLLVLMAAVAFVLLIAATNVANLYLVRGSARQHELAVRQALGARRADLVRMLLAESAIVAAAGGILGWIGSAWAVEALLRFAPRDLARLGEVRMDSRAALFAVATTLLAAAISALMPAWSQSRHLRTSALMEAARGSVRVQGVQPFLVAAQVALCLALTVGGTLMLRSLWNLDHRPLGFQPEHLISFRLSLPWQTGADRLHATYTRVLEQLQSTPGVEGAALTDRLPLDGGTQSSQVEVAGRDPRSFPEGSTIGERAVSPNFQALMRVPLRAGRYLERSDTPLRHAVINTTAARRYFNGENPVGRAIGFRGAKLFEIVGVVADLPEQAASRKVEPSMYVPFNQSYWPLAQFVVKVRGNPAGFADPVRRAVAAVDPSLSVELFRGMDAYLDSRNQTPRLEAWLVSVFALAALGLAGVGIFGLVAGSVAERRVEIGIRMALGAAPAAVLQDTLARLARQMALGIVAGIGLAVLLARLMRPALFEVTAQDLGCWFAGAAVLALVAIGSAWWPARTASQVDPASVLRGD